MSREQWMVDSYPRRLEQSRQIYNDRREFHETKQLVRNRFMEGIGELLGDLFSPGENAGGGGVANVQLNGRMPLGSDYAGDDNPTGATWGVVYQPGVRARLTATDRWNDDILRISTQIGVNPLLVKVLMAVESGGNPDLISSQRAAGLLQVIPNTAAGLGLSWERIRREPVFGIEAGCRVLLSKHNEAAGVIRRAGSRFINYKNRWRELKQDAHGASWLYNGFWIPANPRGRGEFNGLAYADHVAEIYKGFGRNPTVDTAITMDVLGGSSNSNIAEVRERIIVSSAQDASPVNLSGSGMGFMGTEEEFSRLMEEDTGSFGIPVGRFRGTHFIVPDYPRESYVNDRKLTADFMNKTGYAPLNEKTFIHMGSPAENYYSQEARQVFAILLNTSGFSYFIVTRGFSTQGNSSHSIGTAMDIYAETPVDAIKIADAAFRSGIRAIAIGPKFVHVDVGPEAAWNYDSLPMYQGPNTVRVGDLQHGWK